jgi:hypothetical protein
MTITITDLIGDPKLENAVAEAVESARKSNPYYPIGECVPTNTIVDNAIFNAGVKASTVTEHERGVVYALVHRSGQ